MHLLPIPSNLDVARLMRLSSRCSLFDHFVGGGDDCGQQLTRINRIGDRQVSMALSQFEFRD
jgi:hypothetical protein